MTMNRCALALPSALFVLVMACDLGSQSVSGTAEDGGASTDGGATTDDDGTSDTGSTTASDPSADDSGSGSGGPSEPPAEPRCLEMSTMITPDEVSPLGFPASELIALSNGWTTSFGWYPPDGPVDIVPAGTETTLDIGLSYLGGPIVYVDSEVNPDFMSEIPEDCEDRIEIEVEIVFDTGDGRFAEQFLTTAVATSPTALSFTQRFAPDGFSGTFSSAEATFSGEDGTVEGFDLAGVFAAAADPVGTLAIEILVNIGDDPDGGFAGYGFIASWPAELPE